LPGFDSKCIGCKACQVACLEWNDVRTPVGENVGVYDNPPDLTPDMFTVMRFTEWVNPQTQNLEWLIRKDGCMHCADPGCLKACPAPGAIVPVFLPIHYHRAKADCHSRPRRCGDRYHLRVDRTSLCGDLGARDDRGHDARASHRRLGLAASSQVAAGTSHRQELIVTESGHACAPLSKARDPEGS
jgi:ferredoxin